MEYSLAAPINGRKNSEKAIRKAILSDGFKKETDAITQAFGSTTLDASALLIPRTAFLPATDAHVELTIKAIQTRLSENGVVYRYHSIDGLPGWEGGVPNLLLLVH
jgi:GH15 family glucan-1,4-alpha-glucosidase